MTPARKDAGVVDRDGLENRCTLTGTQGSNPCLSATKTDQNRNKGDKPQNIKQFCGFFVSFPFDSGPKPDLKKTTSDIF